MLVVGMVLMHRLGQFNKKETQGWKEKKERKSGLELGSESIEETRGLKSKKEEACSDKALAPCNFYILGASPRDTAFICRIAILRKKKWRLCSWLQLCFVHPKNPSSDTLSHRIRVGYSYPQLVDLYIMYIYIYLLFCSKRRWVYIYIPYIDLMGMVWISKYLVHVISWPPFPHF